MMRGLWKVIRRAAHNFHNKRGSTLAAATAYYALISFVPLILLVIAACGFIFRSSERAVDAVLSFADNTLPQVSHEVAGLIQTLIESQELTSRLGIIGFLWSGSRIFGTLEEAVNVFWECKPRSLVKSLFVTFGLAIGISIFPILSVVLTIGTKTIVAFGDSALGFTITDIPPLYIFITWVFPVILSSLAFSFVFKVLPSCKVHWRSAILGGLLTGFLFEIAKQVFSYYVSSFGNLDRLYGSIAGLVGVVLWAHLGAVVTIFGVELSHQYESSKWPRKK